MPFMRKVAEASGRESEELCRAVLHHFSWVYIDDLNPSLVSAELLLGKDIRRQVLGDGERTLRSGLSLFRFLGLEWREIDRIVPGSLDYYRRNTRVNDTPSFGYAWALSHSQKGSLDCPSPSFRTAMNIQSGQVVIDLMAGSCEEAMTIAKTNPGVRVVAVEINPDNLLKAVDLCKREGLTPEQVTLVPHDVGEPFPMEDQMADAVVYMGYATHGFDEGQLSSLFERTLLLMRPGAGLWFGLLPNVPNLGDSHVHILRKVAQRKGFRLTAQPLGRDVNAFAFRMV